MPYLRTYKNYGIFSDTCGFYCYDQYQRKSDRYSSEKELIDAINTGTIVFVTDSLSKTQYKNNHN